MGLNHRPRDYQSRTLDQLSYAPINKTDFFDYVRALPVELPRHIGVTGGVRIHDMQSHNLPLYQLSYGHMAERPGLEPRLGANLGQISNLLRYHYSTAPYNNTLLPGEEKTRGYNREVKKQARSLDVKNSPLEEFFVSILSKI